METRHDGFSDGLEVSQQSMRNINLTVACWNRFLTRDLVIVPDLVGVAHEFTYQQNTVRISLPSKDHLPKEPLEGKLLTFSCYREDKGEIIPLEFLVRAVDVFVLVPEQVSVPEEVLTRNPNAYEILPDLTQKQLNTLAETYKSVAEKAFDLWIRTLRWKCDKSAIGRPELSGHESGWGTYLVAGQAGKRIWDWHEPSVLNITTKPVTAEVWRAAQSALQNRVYPPVFIDLLFDAIEHMKLGDLQRAAVDMAVACETFLRMLVSNSLPASLSQSVREYIDDANIRTVMSKFVPDILNNEETTQLRNIESGLHQLFDTRNDIVHRGRAATLTPDRCQRFLEATRKLLALRN